MQWMRAAGRFAIGTAVCINGSLGRLGCLSGDGIASLAGVHTFGMLLAAFVSRPFTYFLFISFREVIGNDARYGWTGE